MGIYSLLGKTVADPLATTAGNFLRSIPLVLVASLPFLSELRWDLLGVFYAVLSGALASGVGYAVWYVAVRYLAAFQAATVQLSVPILASLAGIVFLGESLSVRMVLASAAVLGVLRWCWAANSPASRTGLRDARALRDIARDQITTVFQGIEILWSTLQRSSSTGSAVVRSIVVVVLPTRNCLIRECPYAPITSRSIMCSA